MQRLCTLIVVSLGLITTSVGRGQDIEAHIKIKSTTKMKILKLPDGSYLCTKSFRIVVGALPYGDYQFRIRVQAENKQIAYQRAKEAFYRFVTDRVATVKQDPYARDYIRRLQQKKRILKKLIEEIKERVRRELRYQLQPWPFIPGTKRTLV